MLTKVEVYYNYLH